MGGNAILQEISSQLASSSKQLDMTIDFPTRIFYTSRTHSQLSQVVKELNKTSYAECVGGERGIMRKDSPAAT